MDDSSFIFGVDLDGVVGDFYGEMRKIAADWLNKPMNRLRPKFLTALKRAASTSLADMTDCSRSP